MNKELGHILYAIAYIGLSIFSTVHTGQFDPLTFAGGATGILGGAAVARRIVGLPKK